MMTYVVLVEVLDVVGTVGYACQLFVFSCKGIDRVCQLIPGGFKLAVEGQAFFCEREILPGRT